ncbi:MAG: YoaK family protein [Verrucomicrobiota bacterium]
MPFSSSPDAQRKATFRDIRFLLPGAVALTATAGYINTVVLGFFHTPVSHMTGAVAHFGLDLAAGNAPDAWASFSIILGFVLGALVAGVLVGALKLVPNRRYGVVMMVEGGLLVAATAMLTHQTRWGLPAVALACGLQNAMTSSYCGLMIRTTHVTGTVTDVGVMLGHWLRHGQIEWWKLRFLSSLVFGFMVGGWIGALAHHRFGPGCLTLPAAGMALAGGAFWFATHRGLVDLIQDAAPEPPRTSSFPTRRAGPPGSH